MVGGTSGESGMRRRRGFDAEASQGDEAVLDAVAGSFDVDTSSRHPAMLQAVRLVRGNGMRQGFAVDSQTAKSGSAILEMTSMGGGTRCSGGVDRGVQAAANNRAVLASRIGAVYAERESAPSSSTTRAMHSVRVF